MTPTAGTELTSITSCGALQISLVMATSGYELMALLRLSSSHRSLELLERISEAVAHLKFFREQSEEVVKACCKVMKGQLFRRHQIIFHYGDPGTSFYIILKGTVKVLVPLQPTGANRGMAYRKPASRDIEGGMPLREVAQLKTGDSFGELALLHTEERSATIQCKGLVFLGKINREDYNRVLRLQQERKLVQQISFFKSTAAFSSFGEMQLAKLVYFFHERKYTRGAIVYRKGDPCVSVYIVVAGEFVFSEPRKIAADIVDEEGGRPSKVMNVQLFSKGVHEMFGEEEVFQGGPRLLTCTCGTTDGLVYYMSKEEFLKWCQSEGTQKYLSRYRETKTNWLENRFPSVVKGERAKLSMTLPIVGQHRPSSPVAERDQLKRLLVTAGAVGRLKREESASRVRQRSRGNMSRCSNSMIV